MATTLSKAGLATLTLLEGCPLKAYRDVAGVWTIGAGLTKASGVIDPKPGMRITQAEADRLLERALEKQYIPGVVKVLGGSQKQNVIDGAVSFHYNTGAIAKASWVKKFKKGDQAGTRAGLAMYRRSGGRVVKGLVRRREIEADIILKAKYPAEIKEEQIISRGYARLIVPLNPAEIKQVQKDFEKLGYAVTAGSYFHLDAIEKFQRDHDLTVDGVVGKATLATLQRRRDASAKTKVGAGGVVGAGAIGTGGESTGNLDGWTSMIGWSVTILALIYLGYLIWSYRDVIAAKINKRLPRVAAWLWSF